MVVFVVFVVILNPQLQIDRVKDAQRQNDISQIKTALDAYYNDNNCYPASLSGIGSQYIVRLPKDPVAKSDYFFEPEAGVCPQWIMLYAKLARSQPSACRLVMGCQPVNYSSGNYACIALGNSNCAAISAYTIP